MMVERILNEEQFTAYYGMCVFPVEKKLKYGSNENVLCNIKDNFHSNVED